MNQYFRVGIKIQILHSKGNKIVRIYKIREKCFMLKKLHEKKVFVFIYGSYSKLNIQYRPQPLP